MVVGRGDARGGQRVGVFVAFVAEGVEAGGDDVRRGQAFEWAEEGGDAGVGAEGRVGGVVLAVPEDLFLGEEEAFAEEISGRAAADEVDGGVDEELQRRGRDVPYDALLGDDRGEVAARGVAADRDQGRVGAQVFGVLDGPAEGGDGVLGGDRGGGFGGEAVVDRQDPYAGLGRDVAAVRVVGVEVADDPAAAVEEDEEPAARRTGDVEAGAELAVGARTVSSVTRWTSRSGPDTRAVPRNRPARAAATDFGRPPLPGSRASSRSSSCRSGSRTLPSISIGAPARRRRTAGGRA